MISYDNKTCVSTCGSYKKSSDNTRCIGNCETGLIIIIILYIFF